MKTEVEQKCQALPSTGPKGVGRMVHTSLAQERKQRRETLHEILHFSEDLWSAVIHKQLHEDHGKRQHLHRNIKMASRSSSSSHTPRKLKLGTGSVVCQEAEIKGEVTIGSRTVVHPKARILAEAGPIFIGDNNLIEEQATIVNSFRSEGDDQPERITMKIGNHNVFEVGSQCEAIKVGDNNILEAKSKIGRHTAISHGCVIGAMCEVTSQETLPENTVIYGSCCSRRVQAEKPVPQTLQLDFLTKILPNYHHLKKSSRS